MKFFHSTIFMTLLVLLLAACGSGGQKNESNDPNIAKENALRDEVFAIHDGVMPRMTEIVDLKGKLDSLLKTSDKKEEIERNITFLVKAEDGMMEWMTQFQEPAKMRGTKKHEEIMAYLEAEKQRITKVRDAMNNSIQAAQNTLSAKTKPE